MMFNSFNDDIFNKKERGLTESQCLEYVKNYIFYNSKNEICKDMDENDYTMATENKIKENYCLYISNHKHFFGFEEDDFVKFILLFKSIKENPSKSEFPDFISKYGFIEHFQVTATKETRKGSSYMAETNKFCNKIKNTTEKFEKDEQNDYAKIDFNYPVFSYKYFEESFCKNLKKHIKRIDSYNGNKDNKVFLINFPECNLKMYESKFNNWKNGMSQGDLTPPERIRGYKLSRDKHILNYLYNNKNSIDYIIFLSSPNIIEIINIKNIPYILNLLPFDYEISNSSKIYKTVHLIRSNENE